MAIYDVNGNIITGGGDSLIRLANVHNVLDVDMNAFVSGLLSTSDGTITPNANYLTSDYIQVTNGAENVYRLSEFESSNLYNTACYDAAKRFISAATVVSQNNQYYDTDGNHFYYVVFSIPEGTKYIRTSVYKDVNIVHFTTDALETPFNLAETVVIAEEPEKTRDALDIPNLEIIKRFYGKTMIAAGDSITEKNSTASKNWVDWIKEWLKLTVYNDGQGGTGFAKDFMYRGSTIYRIENNWESLYPEEPDIILVMGNQNDGTAGGGGYIATYPEIQYGYAPPVGSISDAGSTFSECGIMRRLLTNLVTKYPKAKIGIISSTPRDFDVTSQFPQNPKSYGMGWYHDYVEAQKAVCADFGVPFLDLYHQNPVLRPYIPTNSTTYYWDGSANTPTNAVHPNNLGHLEGIARPVYEWMLEWL